MKDLYRKSALERLASPDQLDKAPRITSPLSWLALMALTAVVVFMLVWSIVGTLPETVEASGMVVSAASGTNTVYSTTSGRVTSILVAQGTLVYENTPVMVITPVQGDPVTIEAGLVGYVTEMTVKQGDEVRSNGDLMRIAPRTEAAQVVVCYVPTAIVQRVELGMDAYVTLDSADSKTYGHMQGRVCNIDRYATSSNSMNSVLGTDNNMAARFTVSNQQSVPVSAVTLELYPDEGTVSGFWWSSERSADREVHNGAMSSVRIIVKEIAPIEKLFTKIREVWGGE